MILIKEFFRRRSVKIYLFLLTVIIIAITLLLNFSNYYKNLVNDVYLENSRILTRSTYDIKDKLENDEYIINIQPVALVELEEKEEVNDTIFYDSLSQSIILTETKEELGKDNIILNLIHYNYNNIEGIEDNINKEIILKSDKYQNEYKVIDIKESKFTNVSIPKEELDKFISSSEYYTYLFGVTDYQEIDNVVESLIEEDKTECIKLQYLENNAQIETIEALESTVPLLYNLSMILMITFTIIFLLVIHNVLSDEMDNMRIEWVIGFQRRHFFIILLSKIISLLLSSLLIATILYLIISYIITGLLNINIYLFSKDILYFIPLTLFISILYILIFIKKYNYYKEPKVD